MHARVSRFAGLPPEKIDTVLEEFQRDQLPAIEAMPGFKGVVVMVDRTDGKALAITYWETEGDLHNTDKLAKAARDAAVETGGPDREPMVERHEVIFEK